MRSKDIGRLRVSVMPLVRSIFALVVAASLAALPARVGAIGVFAGSGAVISSTSDCVAMGDSSCQPEHVMAAAVDDTVPMSDACDHSGDHGTLPGACSTYCHSLPLIPAIVCAAVDFVLIDSIAPPVVAAMDDIGISPEPHPPKLA
jgi:hypothetical protein